MDLQKLKSDLDQQLILLGFELICLEITSDGCDPILRLYIEHLNQDEKDKPITVDDCMIANSALVDWVNENLPSLREDYVIEVSSPGSERPLVTSEHFRRFCGYVCRIQTRTAINGKKRFKGRIKSSDDEIVALEEDNITYVIPLNIIYKARLAPFDQ